MNDKRRSADSPSPQRGRRPTRPARRPTNTPVRAASRSRSRERQTLSPEANPPAPQAAEPGLFGSEVGSLRKKVGRPRGKSKKYVGLPPRSTSPRLRANAEEISGSSDGIPSRANCRNNSDDRASSDTRAYAITEAGSKALLSVFEKIVETATTETSSTAAVATAAAGTSATRPAMPVSSAAATATAAAGTSATEVRQRPRRRRAFRLWRRIHVQRRWPTGSRARCLRRGLTSALPLCRRRIHFQRRRPTGSRAPSTIRPMSPFQSNCVRQSLP